MAAAEDSMIAYMHWLDAPDGDTCATSTMLRRVAYHGFLRLRGAVLGTWQCIEMPNKVRFATTIAKIADPLDSS